LFLDFSSPSSFVLNFASIKMPGKPVPLRTLGKNDPRVPALGFGLIGMSYVIYGSISGDDERFGILDLALELGDTFWDTSE
jgi:aryl-alcohol dehydrogenase-like predicted oxidoreductase